MILHIKTTAGDEYRFPVSNKIHAAEVLINLQRMGILCQWWKYDDKEVKEECSQAG